MMEVTSRASASLEAKIIRADGTVEDLGEIWNSNCNNCNDCDNRKDCNKNINLEEEQNNGASR